MYEWQKQNLIPGQDYETICGLLDSIKGKLDDDGGNEITSKKPRDYVTNSIRLIDLSNSIRYN